NLWRSGHLIRGSERSRHRALFRGPGERGASGLIVLPEPVAGSNRTLIIELAAKHKLPAIYPFDFYARDGGLLSYGIDQRNLYAKAASYVDRILKGETNSLPNSRWSSTSRPPKLSASRSHPHCLLALMK